jgi:hypothetical protein
MIEANLYPIIRNYLESNLGYYPVRIAPSISIRGYRPDVTGIKGKRVVTVEAKLGFDEKSMMESVTQAKVYSIGSTHAYVAFPLSDWTDGKEQLRKLCTELCRHEGIGIYLVDTNDESLKEELDAELSRYIDLDDYEKTVKQLEGDKELILYNTYPEYVRDVCIYVSHLQEPLIRKELIPNLMKDFDNQYWTIKSGARSIPEEEKAENRIVDAVNGTLELGLTRYDSLFQGDVEIKRITLTRNGRLLVNLCGKSIDYRQPEPLNDRVKVFFSTYLLQFPIFNIALDILEKMGKEMIFGNSVCNCGFATYDFGEFKVGKDGLICPECGQSVDAGFSHQLHLDYGDKECYHELKFTKTLGDDPLFLFEFGKISRWNSIKLGL